MEYRVLGTLEMRAGGVPVPLGPPKQRAVLAILLLHAGEVIPTDRLIEMAWGERAPRTASHSLQVYVSELRKVLERDTVAPVLVTRPPGYVLEADPDQIDARRFERLSAQAARDLESGDPSAAATVFREALGLWRGGPLSDFVYEEFAQDEIRRLEALHVDALEHLAAAELALGREQAALAVIDTAIAEDPLRERSRELQMLALYRSGRHPEALRAYQRFHALLGEELGIEPTPSLQQLQERVLLHDPTLAPAVPGSTPAPVPVRNPYKGLRPFGEEDADDFFGREALVAELVAALARGTRLVALVGPSGSGKSSVIHAGLVPALRTATHPNLQGWVIARMRPGQHPFEELRVALGRALPRTPPGQGEGLGEGDADLLDAAERILPDGGRLLLVIDQFEELFSYGDELVAQRFLRDLTAAVADPDRHLTVVLALRADYYDRPLLHPGFASVFAGGVINVVPMTADGLEAAVVRPARRVGVEVDPALLSQLTADTIDQPGALPLLQYTLTELFDRRADRILTLEEYRALGGLHGALSRRAEGLYARLGEDRRQVVLQVLLRLVTLGEGARHSRRRVPVRELSALDLDPVALSEVLEELGRHRLLSFDRDPDSGNATVELAHEALLWEWERLADWIERHRTDLREHHALAAAAGEWESSGHDPDYLPIGSRLAGYESWSKETALRLTVGEREFLGAGIARRHAEEAEEAARLERQRRLERRARTRLWALLGAIAVLTAAATFAVLAWLGARPPNVALLVEGTGDAGFGDMSMAGLERARANLGLSFHVWVAKSGSREVEATLRDVSDAGVPLVVVGIGALATDATTAVAVDHPETRYVVYENYGELPTNVTNLTFRSEEGAYLAGIAAALKSRTGVIGFIGAMKVPEIEPYLAGYEAGARSVVRDIEVRAVYLAKAEDFTVFSSRALAAAAATRLYSDRADVILAVAGSLPGQGVFEVATSASTELGRQLWVIGVDTDQFRSALMPTPPEVEGHPEWQPHVLTSVMKELDVAFYTVLADYARGSLAPGPRSLGLAEGAVDISYSGGYIDDIRQELEDRRDRIVSGTMVVPTVPTDAVLTEAP